MVGGQLEGIWEKLSEFREQGMSLESVRDLGAISNMREKKNGGHTSDILRAESGGMNHRSQAPGPTEVSDTLEMYEP